MLPLYKDRKAAIEIYYRQSRHVPPHVHETVELIYVADGTLELGVGNNLYHMEKGDFGLIFPNVVHYYQVLEANPGKSLNIIAAPELSGTYYPTLQKYCPENPVIKADDPLQRMAVRDFDANMEEAGGMLLDVKRVCTWYAAWTAAAQARLGDGAGALRNLQKAASTCGRFGEIFEYNDPGAMSIPWCSSPQGTFVQAVNEMLVQCAGDEIRLAPAVPPGWKDFSFRLKAYDDLTVEATGKASSAYADKILKKWKDAGCSSSVEAVERFLEEERAKRGAPEKKPAGRSPKHDEIPKTYDSGDFFARAVERSYQKKD